MNELTVLGTGNAQSVNFYNTCFYLKTAEGGLLVDAGGGNGILGRLRDTGIDILSIRHMFLTHAHCDHILGAVWVTRIIGQKIREYEGSFTVYGHREVLDALRRICEITVPQSVIRLFDERIIFRELQSGERVNLIGSDFTFFDIGSSKMKQFAFTAVLPGGGRLSFLGDEPLSAAGERYIEGSNWLLTEAFCLYAEREKFRPYEKHHTTVKEAAECAEERNIPNLVLLHTEDSHDGDRSELYETEARRYYSGRVIVPADGCRIRL